MTMTEFSPTEAPAPALTVEVSAAHLITLLSNVNVFIDPLRPALNPCFTFDPETLTLHGEATDSYILFRQSIMAAGGAPFTFRLDRESIKTLVAWAKLWKLARVTLVVGDNGRALTASAGPHDSTMVRLGDFGRYPNTESLLSDFLPSNVGSFAIRSDRLADMAKLRAIGSKASERPDFKFEFGKSDLHPARWSMVGDNAYGLLMPVRVR